MAKQRHLPFPVSTNASQCPFDLVHVDIWGPFSVQSINGSRFFFTIVDDFSRYTWIYLMHSKFQTRFIVQSFFTMVNTHFNLRIKSLRFDNGVELKMNDFFSHQGTLYQLNCVETLQQNSIVERKHQHLLNVARALRFQAHLPLSFWADCVLTATHLINRIPSPILSNKSPFELLYSTPPIYSHLRVFGCLAFASTLNRDRNKFDSWFIPSIFIGYPHGTKGYKLFSLTTKFVFHMLPICYILILRGSFFLLHLHHMLINLLPFPLSFLNVMLFLFLYIPLIILLYLLLMIFPLQQPMFLILLLMFQFLFMFFSSSLNLSLLPSVFSILIVPKLPPGTCSIITTI